MLTSLGTQHPAPTNPPDPQCPVSTGKVASLAGEAEGRGGSALPYLSPTVSPTVSANRICQPPGQLSDVEHGTARREHFKLFLREGVEWSGVRMSKQE